MTRLGSRSRARRQIVTRFLLDTSTVTAAIWKDPDPGVLAQLSEHAASARSARRPGTNCNSEPAGFTLLGRLDQRTNTITGADFRSTKA